MVGCLLSFVMTKRPRLNWRECSLKLKAVMPLNHFHTVLHASDLKSGLDILRNCSRANPEKE